MLRFDKATYISLFFNFILSARSSNHPGIVSLNFHSNRIITENMVPITVDWLIKIIHAMWMPLSNV